MESDAKKADRHQKLHQIDEIRILLKIYSKTGDFSYKKFLN